MTKRSIGPSRKITFLHSPTRPPLAAKTAGKHLKIGDVHDDLQSQSRSDSESPSKGTTVQNQNRVHAAN